MAASYGVGVANRYALLMDVDEPASSAARGKGGKENKDNTSKGKVAPGKVTAATGAPSNKHQQAQAASKNASAANNVGNKAPQPGNKQQNQRTAGKRGKAGHVGSSNTNNNSIHAVNNNQATQGKSPRNQPPAAVSDAAKLAGSEEQRQPRVDHLGQGNHWQFGWDESKLWFYEAIKLFDEKNYEPPFDLLRSELALARFPRFEDTIVEVISEVKKNEMLNQAWALLKSLNELDDDQIELDFSEWQMRYLTSLMGKDQFQEPFQKRRVRPTEPLKNLRDPAQCRLCGKITTGDLGAFRHLMRAAVLDCFQILDGTETRHPMIDWNKVLSMQNAFVIYFQIPPPSHLTPSLPPLGHVQESNICLRHVLRNLKPLSYATLAQCCCQKACSADCNNRRAHIECDEKNCSLGVEDCGNRLFQNGADNIKTTVIDAGKRGRGLRIDNDVEMGALIMEIKGTYIARGKENHCDFIYLKLGTRLVDLSKSNLRFVNHSCDPNCVVAGWDVQDEERFGLFSKRFIPSGTELTFDYGSSTTTQTIMCECGSANCRQYLGLPRSQGSRLQGSRR